MQQEAHRQRFCSGMLQIGGQEKVVIAMVGLPARGKSYFSKKIRRFLHWLGYSCKIFNIGNYRRKQVEKQIFQGTTNCKADFFDPTNENAQKLRQEAAQSAIDDLISFLKNGGDVAIYDGTNTTKERRQFINRELEMKLPNTFLMFSELICDDQTIINNNIRLTKLNNPDYKSIDPDVAQKDFRERIAKYESVYEKVDDDENFSYIKLFNLGKKFVVNNITGFLPCKIISFIFHYHIQSRPIYLSRAGKVNKYREVLGGDQTLGNDGKAFGQNLNDFFQEEFPDLEQRKKVTILTSTRISALQTAKYIDLGVNIIQMKCLDELNFGLIDGMDIQEVKQNHQDIYQNHLRNDITYRYPKGESFLDLISRLEPVIFEIERSLEPVIVVSHHYMLKALYCYFVSKKVDDVMTIEIPKHHLIKIVPDVNDCEEQVFDLDPKTPMGSSKRVFTKNYLQKTSDEIKSSESDSPMKSNVYNVGNGVHLQKQNNNNSNINKQQQQNNNNGNGNGDQKQNNNNIDNIIQLENEQILQKKQQIQDQRKSKSSGDFNEEEKNQQQQ